MRIKTEKLLELVKKHNDWSKLDTVDIKDLLVDLLEVADDGGEDTGLVTVLKDISKSLLLDNEVLHDDCISQEMYDEVMSDKNDLEQEYDKVVDELNQKGKDRLNTFINRFIDRDVEILGSDLIADMKNVFGLE